MCAETAMLVEAIEDCAYSVCLSAICNWPFNALS